MRDDIVTRLNEHPTVACGACDTWGKRGFRERRSCICHRTERLHEEAAAEIERLRTAGDALVAAIRNHDLREEHVKAWEEARRG